MIFIDAVAYCKVGGYVARDSEPEEKYWKNDPIPLHVRVPLGKQTKTDWEHYDPEGEETVE